MAAVAGSTIRSIAKVQRVVQHLGIGSLLAASVTATDITNGKPHPAPYLAGACKAGVPASRGVAFEDATGGVRSAVAAGATCIGIGDANAAPPLLAAGAAAVVADLTAIRVGTVAQPAGGYGIQLRVGDCLDLPFVSRWDARERRRSVGATGT